MITIGGVHYYCTLITVLQIIEKQTPHLNHQKKLWLIDDVTYFLSFIKSQKKAKDKNKPGSLIRTFMTNCGYQL